LEGGEGLENELGKGCVHLIRQFEVQKHADQFVLLLAVLAQQYFNRVDFCHWQKFIFVSQKIIFEFVNTHNSTVAIQG